MTKQEFDEFMKLVNAANPTFERRKTSSLRPLINLLANPPTSSGKVQAALMSLPTAKQSKYWKALLYLRLTYTPTLNVNLAGGLALGKLNAAIFKRNPALPEQWDTDFSGQEGAQKLYQPKIEKEIAATKNNFLGKSLEHYILENPLKLGAVLVHLGGYVDELGQSIEGKTHFEHLVSVLEVLAHVGAPLCVLLQKRATGEKITDDVCA